ncbi:hypothetical protein ACWC4D_23760 [Streptomyces sp. NPDC001288]|uniref:hypothetical protein n=1 Tax=Streptomyces sp. NPDC001297 TaxID=3364559 RepID=UPI0036A907FA
MKSSNLVLGLLPWILFSFLTRQMGAGTVGWAALGACLICLVLTIRAACSDGLTTIDVVGVVTFGSLAATGLLGSDHIRHLLADYGRAGAAYLLAAVMLVSVLTVPFTEQYARVSVDRRYWKNPAFRSVNRRISLLWSAVVLGAALCHTLAGALGTNTLLLNWLLPALLGFLALRQTKAIAHRAGAAHPEP